MKIKLETMHERMVFLIISILSIPAVLLPIYYVIFENFYWMLIIPLTIIFCVLAGKWVFNGKDEND